MRQRPNPEALRHALRTALEAAAGDMPTGAPKHIDRLTLRLGSDAGPKDVARALGNAIRTHGRPSGEDGS